jgi:alpha-ketoglutarate-dependent 2,4-dichlorophenoxyacetate dioxygenase
MSLTIEAIQSPIAARITGIDLSTPLSNEDAQAIDAAIAQYPVLVFPSQMIDDDALLAFSECFGPVQVSVQYTTRQNEHRLQPKISDISNVGKDDEIFKVGDARRMNTFVSRRWHSDQSYQPIPARYSFLLNYSVPAHGGESQFADMRLVYDSLPADLRETIEDLSAEFDILYTRASCGFTEFPAEERAALHPSMHRLVKTHPLSGRKTLYLSVHACRVIGWPLPEGRDLLRELMEFATQPQFIYTHKWTVRDLVMWDNRVLIHRGLRYSPPTDRREMHRATVMDDPSWTRRSVKSGAAA